jgi:hypothetical protein
MTSKEYEEELILNVIWRILKYALRYLGQTESARSWKLLPSIDLKTRHPEKEACVLTCVIVGFCCAVDNYALQGYYTASSGNSLPTFRNTLIRCVTAQNRAVLTSATNSTAMFPALLYIYLTC